MYSKALKLFYVLSIFVLGTVLFVMTHSTYHATRSMQEQFSIAWQQTWGDQPYFTEIADVFDGVAEFYDQAGDATISLLSSPEADQDVIHVFSKVYDGLAQIFGKNSEQVALDPAKFMSEQPIYNIVPAVAGASVDISGVDPVNLHNPWFTARDAMTGQIYCTAIYNGEVNKYLGSCKSDTKQN